MPRANAVYICGPVSGGACPECGKDTDKDYAGARICYQPDGGCGWSDYYPNCPVTPHDIVDCPGWSNDEHDPERAPDPTIGGQ